MIERYVVKNGRTDEITEEVERFSELEYSNGNGLPTICTRLEILKQRHDGLETCPKRKPRTMQIQE